MNHLTDRQVDDAIFAVLSDDLSFHARRCGECRARIANAKLIERALRRTEAERVGEEFTAAVLRRLGIQSAAPMAWRFMKGLAPAVAFLIMVGCALALLKLTGSGGGVLGKAIGVQGTQTDVAGRIGSAVTAVQAWGDKVLPFMFSGGGSIITAFLIGMLALAILIDRHFLGPMLRRKN